VANCARPEVGFAGSDDRGATALLPFEYQMRWVPVQSASPTDRHAALFGRQRAVLCRVGGELMKHHCHRLTRLRLQYDFGAVDLGIVAGGVRCEFAANELRQQNSLPPTGAQQLVRGCHRANAPLEGYYKIGYRPTPLAGVGNDSFDGRERVLDAMVKLGDQ